MLFEQKGTMDNSLQDLAANLPNLPDISRKKQPSPYDVLTNLGCAFCMHDVLYLLTGRQNATISLGSKVGTSWADVEIDESGSAIMGITHTRPVLGGMLRADRISVICLRSAGGLSYVSINAQICPASPVRDGIFSNSVKLNDFREAAGGHDFLRQDDFWRSRWIWEESGLGLILKHHSVTTPMLDNNTQKTHSFDR